jgi:hypothetical protein
MSKREDNVLIGIIINDGSLPALVLSVICKHVDGFTWSLCTVVGKPRSAKHLIHSHPLSFKSYFVQGQ